MDKPICVQSEVGRLRTVMLHRPGTELENLMPDYLARQLFDDIPYLVHAREEHDQFAKTLRDCGVKVLYLDELLQEAVEAAGVQEELTWEYIREANINAEGAEQAVNEYLSEKPLKELVQIIAGGVRKSDIPNVEKRHLVDYTDDKYPFYVDPMPNLYFTRDPFMNVGDGVLISRMANEVRRRETLFAKYIFKYHPVYKWVPKYHDRTDVHSLEGGDCLVLSPETVAFGMSQRTSAQAVELAANRLIGDRTGIRQILAVDIPKVRAFMQRQSLPGFFSLDSPKISSGISVLNLASPY